MATKQLFEFNLLDTALQMYVGQKAEIDGDTLTVKRYNSKTNTLWVKINNQPELYLTIDEFTVCKKTNLSNDDQIAIDVLKYEISIVRSNIEGYRNAIMENQDTIRILKQKIEDIKNAK